MTTKELFAENLRNMLLMKGKRQTELAKYTGATTATVSYWCNGEAMPRAKMLDKICLFLGCSVDDLLTDHSKPTDCTPEDILVEELKANPQLMRLLFRAMRLTPDQLEKLIQKAGEIK